MFKVGIITASDKGYAHERVDESGKVIKEIVEKNGYSVAKYLVLPDDEAMLSKEMIYMSDEMKVNLILTTGGTGFSERDVTPEATLKVVDKLAPGIVEAIRHYSLSITKRAMLSRAVSGIRNKTLIINLPGSPKAVRESLEYIIDTLQHGLEILQGIASECARK
ncbi:molybdenum cofactor biosynthesis protein B [Haloimpatiens sp. FM7330]|uniref:MogA/MoaB family molybdenum cofactor biosynthesis protein n=1 Tax=Haloimpatiens sp. FM7330 TaxID=3298610 RepID=UPI00364178E5